MDQNQLCERELPAVREVGEQPTIQGDKLVGYAVVFGEPSHPLPQLGGRREIIERDAFDLTGNVSFLNRHDDRSEYGDTDSKTLTLTPDERGIRYELTLPPYAKMLRREIVDRLIKGVSVGFYPRKVEYRNGVQHVVKGQLVHIAAVYTPAYPQTSIELVGKSHTGVLRKKMQMALLKS